MITEQALLEAIAECQGERNPDARTCRNLASFYTILDHINQELQQPVINQYSGDDGYTNSELSKAIQEKGLATVLPALDELLDAVQVYNPKLYKSFLRKL